ncbi:MAG: hypothetical protein ACLSAH_10000 [Bilophila wadsworthia]
MIAELFLMNVTPNAEFWFSTDSLGRDIYSSSVAQGFHLHQADERRSRALSGFLTAACLPRRWIAP